MPRHPLVAILLFSAGLVAASTGLEGTPEAHAGSAERATRRHAHAAPTRHAGTRSGSGSARRCPDSMALVKRAAKDYCVDRYEASLMQRAPGGRLSPWPANHVVDGHEQEMVAVSVAGRTPQGYVSGAQARVACENAGKRLCEIDEWLEACRGPRGQTYPYGNVQRPGACNDRYQSTLEHPVRALFERYAKPNTDPRQMWQMTWMNDPRLFDLPHGVEAAGAHPECKSAYGTYDMVGNLHEWVADPSGTFVGGYFMDTHKNGEGCAYRTVAHDFRYHDYSTGFRCCKDAAPR